MATIRNLTVRNQVDGRATPIPEVDGELLISELLDAYKAEVGIPPSQEITIKKKSTNKQLSPKVSLEDAGVRDNDTLIVEMSYTAG
ncbi:MAG: hypothetical protein HC884_09040 [Chloroflexaceae bacterium]|nr:hypothetical protein [Chloroflexaceae bacterium]